MCLVAGASGLAPLPGCATTGGNGNGNVAMLTQAGFTAFPAGSPQQKQAIQTLSPSRISKVQRKGKTYFVFPDTANQQVYVGNQTNYNQYRQLRAAQTASNERSSMSTMDMETGIIPPGGDTGVWAGWTGWDAKYPGP